MKRILLTGVIVAAAVAVLVFGGGASNGTAAGTYKIELDNAFGLVTGADFKVAGVRAGTIKSIDLDQKTLHAVVTVQVTQNGFGQFHADAFCQSRPQSLIGEYFIDCQPGSSGPVLKPGSTIPVARTFSTIPADLLQDVMRMPYRERFSLIINELGAGVAGRSGDLQAALQRAVPALSETDNLLNLLANDSHTLQQLTANSDAVITALANNSAQVQRFVVEANNTATDTATQDANLKATFQKLPAFLEQLRPSMKQLGETADANTPVLQNLNSASGQLNRLFTDLPSFSKAALPAIKTLGQASVTGKQAVDAARPTISDLNTFAQPTPELAQNLAIVLHDLDDRSRAVEKDPRSPGGQGYTGLEALLQYVFNQTVAINTFGPFGHQLTVDGFLDPRCTAYATPATIAQNLQSFGSSYRQCYSWLGPSQPGVNETDPSDPSAKVPDPGGAPPGQTGPATTAQRLTAADVARAEGTQPASKSSSSPRRKPATHASNPSAPKRGATSTTATPGTTTTSGGSTTTTTAPSTPVPVGGLQKTLGNILSILGGGSSSSSSTSSTSSTSTSSTSTSSPSSTSSGNEAQTLLNYLLAP